MLQRVSSPAPYLPKRWLRWWPREVDAPVSLLMRYLAVLVILCGLGCIYLWQTSTVAELERDTQKQRKHAMAIEAENVRLMQQLAQWDSPRYVYEQLEAQGAVVKRSAIQVALPSDRGEAVVTEMQPQPSLIRRIRNIIPGLGNPKPGER